MAKASQLDVPLALKILLNFVKFIQNISLMNFEVKNTNYKEAISDVLQRQNFMKHIGFTLDKISPGYMEGSLPFNEFLKQQAGFLHGGAIATLADLVCG